LKIKTDMHLQWYPHYLPYINLSVSILKSLQRSVFSIQQLFLLLGIIDW